MPTEKEIIARYGQEMWDKMGKTGWLDGITMTIKEAVVVYDCDCCGCTLQKKTPGYDIGAKYTCPDCKTKGALRPKRTISMVADIPESYIDRAYRAAKGEKVYDWEMD